MTDLTQTYAIPARPERIGLWRLLALMLRLRRQRIELAQMTDAQLRDIGVTAAQARAEAARPVWDVPRSWLN